MEDGLYFCPAHYHSAIDPNPILHRICPGRHFANDTLFLLLASVLSVYNISPALDDAGNPTEVDADSPGAGILLYVFTTTEYRVVRS